MYMAPTNTCIHNIYVTIHAHIHTLYTIYIHTSFKSMVDIW